jgi:hypothetical protein
MSETAKLSTLLAQRAALIRVASGYKTDIGARVYRGKRALDAEAIPCCVIVEGDDVPREGAILKNTNVIIDVPFQFEALLPCDPNNPNDAAHDAIADICAVLFGGDDPNFGGILKRGLVYVGRTIEPRVAGTATVGVAIKIRAEVKEDLTHM